MSRIQPSEAQSLLIQLLGDPEAQIRQAAVVALGEIGGAEARSRLQELARSNDKDLAKAAAKALYGGGFRRQPSETTQKRLDKIRGIRGDERPLFYISLEAAIRELPTIEPYEEAEFTRRIAKVCADYSSTRRYLVMNGSRSIMKRANGIYELTDLGKAVWRVEHFILEHYLS